MAFLLMYLSKNSEIKLLEKKIDFNVFRICYLGKVEHVPFNDNHS